MHVVTLADINGLRSCIKHLKECFTRYPNTSKPVKKLGCASFFQPTSLCLDILMKHSFSCLIYYVLKVLAFLNFNFFNCNHCMLYTMIVFHTFFPVNVYFRGGHRQG